MSVSRCGLSAAYRMRNDDLVLLPWIGPRRRLFSSSVLPKLPARLTAPQKAGGDRCLFAGLAGDLRLHVQGVRLDAEHLLPAAALSRAVAGSLELAAKQSAERVVVCLDAATPKLVKAAFEGAVLGSYRFDRYLRKRKKRIPVLLVVGKTVDAAGRAALRDRKVLLTCVNFARDMQNEPPNVLKPSVLAERFRKAGEASGLRVEVWDERRLARERCGGILGVGMGCRARPRMVIARYRPRTVAGHLCLVGKGVTFDSGGYGLKPATSQVGMKYDMSGAAVVFAAACAIAKLKLPIQITVITPIAENSVSGEAMPTTSILKTRSGRTVEVEHTDAEGRLMLADALALAGEQKADWIVDAATLTGAAVVALGEDMAAVFGTDRALTRSLVDAGMDEDEMFWELPLHMPYRDLLKATIADTRNVATSKWGGAITAAVFLRQWVEDGTPWIHCDIAGPGVKEEPLGHLGKGGKGFGVKALVEFARKLSAGEKV